MSDAGKTTVVVRILDQEYRIEGEADSDRMVDVARFVDGKMRLLAGEKQPTASARLAVLTALNIAEELFRERDARDVVVDEVDRRLKQLVEELERATG